MRTYIRTLQVARVLIPTLVLLLVALASPQGDVLRALLHLNMNL